MPPANKTSWTKESAVLLVKIVGDVEQKILRKELQVGKENGRTKWDYVAARLHEASESDASKTATHCKYKFWELNRHYRFLLKEEGGQTIIEEKEGPIFSALKGYYELFPPNKKIRKSKRQSENRRSALSWEIGSMDGGLKRFENPEHQMNVQSRELVPVSSFDEDGDVSGDESGGSPHNHTKGLSIRELLMSRRTEDESNEESSGSPHHHADGEAGEQPGTSGGASPSARAKSGKRKASERENVDLVVMRQEEDCSSRIKEMVDKMARLSSYMKWKQTGVGEDWRCDFTDRIERRQKRNRKKVIHSSNQIQDETEIQVPDEIESALRDDILSYWNELDKNRPTEEECQRYYRKKYAGELRY